MREIKYHAYLDSEERTILLHSLVDLENVLNTWNEKLAEIWQTK